jgi:cytochrome b6-f complex iron-sulfur subunit
VSPGTIALIVVAVSVAGWALFMANITIRRQRKTAALSDGGRPDVAEGTEPAPAMMTAEPAAAGAGAGGGLPEVTVQKVPPKERKPLTPAQLAVSRRQFLTRAWTASFTTFLGLFGMSTLSFLWPKLTGGFGTVIPVGNYDDLIKEVGPEGGFLPKFVAEGRFWLTYYDGTGDAPVYLAVNAKETKLQALYRKCVHLGCSVPHCQTSMLFECPCHGSKYRLTGEYFGGPAPRGLDRFPVSVSGGKVSVDTGARQDGPPRGTNTWNAFSEPRGSFCVPAV